MYDETNININLAINTFIFYFNTTIWFLFIYKNINLASTKTIYFILVAEIFLNGLVRKMHKKNNLARSYGIIILLFITLLPVFKNMTAQIDTDTIYFICFICMVVYCIETTKNNILRLETKRPEFDRNKPIPIELALLIPYKHQNNNTAGNIASAFSLFNIVSRVKNDHEALYLLKIGFFVFCFLPSIYTHLQIVFTTKLTVAFVALSQLVFFLTNNFQCLNLSLFVLIPTYAILHAIKRCINGNTMK